MTPAKFKNFRKALVAWARADLTATGSTGGLLAAVGGVANNIRARTQDEEAAPLPGLLLTIQSVEKAFDGCDEIYTTNVLCEAFALDALTALDIAGAVENLAAMNPTTYADAEFVSSGVRTVSLRSVGAQAPYGESTILPNVYGADVLLRIVWKEA